MAAALIERQWRESTPEGVEDDLAALWRDVASRGAVARAVMSNLVVFRFHDRRLDAARTGDPAPAAAVLDAVVALHPSRAIIIEHDRGDHDPRSPIGAGVGVCVFGPESARYGVEQVLVRSACAEVSLPSIVRRFVRGDLPTSVWWTEDLSRFPPLPALIAAGRQFVYDSRTWSNAREGFRTVSALARDHRIDVADLNWRRTSPLRRAMVHAAKTIPSISTVTTPDVRISHRHGEEALAWLVAGWLAARLGPEGAWPSINESIEGDEILVVRTGEGDRALSATMNDHRVLVQQHDVPPMTVPASEEDVAAAIAAELRSLSHDAALRDALTAMVFRAVQS
jgi:hypothetical protein